MVKTREDARAVGPRGRDIGAAAGSEEPVGACLSRWGTEEPRGTRVGFGWARGLVPPRGAFGVQEALRVHRHATKPCGGDGLPVVVIRHVPGGEDTRNAGRGGHAV